MLPPAQETIEWAMERYRWVTKLFSSIAWLAGLLILVCITFVLVFASLRCFTPKYASKLELFFKPLIIRLIETLFSTFPIFGGKSRQKILYVPNAGQQSVESWSDYIYKSKNHRNGFCEISQEALSRYLLSKETADLIDELNIYGSSKTFDKTMYDMLCCLKDFNKEAQINNFEIYRSSMHWLFDPLGIHHTFIVFQTSCQTEGEYWWSLEKNMEYIVMQRSKNQWVVVNSLMRRDRKNVELIPKNNPAEGQDTRTMTKLLTTLWAYNITEKYHVVKASCQTFVQFIERAYHKSFVDFVHKRLTSYEPAVPYAAPSSNKKLEAILNLLTKFPEWPPLFSIVYLGDPILLENLLCNCKTPIHTNVINVVAHDTSVLQLAILFSKFQMVEKLLQITYLNTAQHNDEGSDKPWKGMSVFHTAAAFTGDAKIIDLLFKSDKVNTGNDAMGRTALHIAVMESNEITVGHLLKMNQIEPNARDTDGLTPFHLAAQHTDNTKIIDLLLRAKKNQKRDTGIDGYDTKGRTALHHAVMGSNLTIARHLIEKGSNPNQTDEEGTTPLELAAQHAKDMKIVDLFLENEIVYNDLKVKGGDKVYNSAQRNTNLDLREGINQLLRNKKIERKQDIPPVGQFDHSTETQRKPEPNDGEIKGFFAANCSIL